MRVIKNGSTGRATKGESRECLFSEIRHYLFRSLFRPCRASPSPTHRVRHPTLFTPSFRTLNGGPFLPSVFFSLFFSDTHAHVSAYILALSFILTAAASRSGVCEPRDTMLCLRIAGLTYFVC